MQPLKTVERHIMEREHEYPGASGEFSGLLWALIVAGKVIAHQVKKAGLHNMLGKLGRINVQNEEVQKLDSYANEVILQTMSHGGYVCALASEEEEDIKQPDVVNPRAKYVLNFDPLDGSSNIDANVSIGTIFSILERITPGDQEPQLADCLQPGFRQAAAGYFIYGSSTMMVYTTGHGVHGFTLDPGLGEFIMSQPFIRTPKKGRIYSINEGNTRHWEPWTHRFIQHLKESETAHSGRYIGSLVADFHRNLLYGGIFLYPADRKNKNGKLRLLYEANPLAFIIEEAGGLATDGTNRILTIQPDELHQRTPLIIGSSQDVELAHKFFQENNTESIH